jgi:hypothetical protein
MGDIEDLDSAILVFTELLFRILKITNRDHPLSWETFTWRFSESTSDNLGIVVDFTNNITREVGITVAFKLENCNINVIAGKK